VFGRRRANVWPQQHEDVQVTIHRTVEVNVDVRQMDEERGSIKQTVTLRSQEEMDMITAELQMKKDLQI
jgi:hypothetical protein